MEIWKPVIGHEFYEVSDQGRVRSLDRSVFTKKHNGMKTLKGKVLKPIRYGHKGKEYPAVSLSHPKRRACIHVLVLEAFVGPRPHGLDGCHNDGIRDNCRLDNLRWDTRTSNILDSIEHGTFSRHTRPCGEKHGNSKLSEKDIRAIREKRASGAKLKELAQEFDVTETTISLVYRGKLWAHI